MIRLITVGGDGVQRYWRNEDGADGGWMPDPGAASLMPVVDALEIMGRLEMGISALLIAPVGGYTQTAVSFKPDASDGPADSACSGSFCEVANRYNKGAS